MWPTPTSRPPSRLSLWARLFRGQSLIRHPVSISRHRVGTTLLLVMCVFCGFYFYLTRDESIRRRTVAYLSDATSAEVTVGRAQFSMFSGITLHDVHVSTPYDKELDPSAVDPRTREIFSANSLTVYHSPWRLLLGGLRIERIVATEPVITLSQNTETGKRNWRSLFQKQTPGGPKKTPRRPMVTLRSAQVDVVSIDTTGHQLRKSTRLDADVRPHPQNDWAYCIEVRRLTAPGERTTVIFNPEDRLVANAPFVDFATIGLQLPKAYQDFFQMIGLEGDLKVARINYTSETRRSKDQEIEIRDVKCRVPRTLLQHSTSQPGAATQPTEDPLSFTDLSGRMVLRDDNLDVELMGRLNGAPCRVEGRIDHIKQGVELRDLGLDLRLTFDRFIMPEGDVRETLLDDPRIHEDLRDFLCKYDPHGAYDIECHLVRPAFHGPGRSFHGVIRSRGGFGSYYKFPYLVTELTGEIHISPERIVFEDFRGIHGAGTVRINGTVEFRDFYNSLDLYIHTSGIPLDDELFAALPTRFRGITERFGPRGTADVLVHVYRDSGPFHQPKPQFHTTVTAELVDARAAFEQFPYPLDHLYGTVRVADERIELVGLNGRHGDASVRIDGYATTGATGPPDIELRVEAHDVALDADLAEALPEDTRKAFTRLRAAGRADVLGRVFKHGEGAHLSYDLSADLRGTTMWPEDLPVRLTDVAGRLRIRPGDLAIERLTARRGEMGVTASGSVRRGAGDQVESDFALVCDPVPFDDELHAAVPGMIRRIWDQFSPRGRCTLQTQIHYDSGDADHPIRHRTLIETTDALATYQGFPVPLTNVASRVLFTDRDVEIQEVKAKYGAAPVQLRGDIDLAEPGRRGTLTVSGQGLTFDPVLVAAFPRRLSEAITAIAAKGKFDIQLDTLQFETDGADNTAWDYAGTLRFTDLSADLGFDLTEAEGTLSGRGSIARNGDTAVDVRAELAKAGIGSWRFTRAQTRFRMDAGSDTLRVEDGAADIYGGQASGTAEVTFAPDANQYKASITFRDAELARFLEENKPHAKGAGTKKPNDPDGHAPETNADGPTHGHIYGNLFLRGRTGPRRYREGGGEMFIREAQVWKLPVAMAVFQVLNLAPDENAFHDGWLKFFLNENTLTLQKIDLQGKAMSFVGGGRMDLQSGGLDVTLLAGSPVRIRLPILTDLVEAASREIMEVRIRGTVENPKIVPQPLKSLGKALETLFPEPPESRHESHSTVTPGSERRQ